MWNTSQTNGAGYLAEWIQLQCKKDVLSSCLQKDLLYQDSVERKSDAVRNKGLSDGDSQESHQT
jgi:hypothetical protein